MIWVMAVDLKIFGGKESNSQGHLFYLDRPFKSDNAREAIQTDSLQLKTHLHQPSCIRQP